MDDARTSRPPRSLSERPPADAVAGQGSARDVWGYGRDNLVGLGRVRSPMPFSLRKFLAGWQVIPHQASFFGSSLVEKIGGYDVNFGVAADQEFILRAALLRQPIKFKIIAIALLTTAIGLLVALERYLAHDEEAELAAQAARMYRLAEGLDGLRGVRCNLARPTGAASRAGSVPKAEVWIDDELLGMSAFELIAQLETGDPAVFVSQGLAPHGGLVINPMTLEDGEELYAPVVVATAHPKVTFLRHLAPVFAAGMAQATTHAAAQQEPPQRVKLGVGVEARHLARAEHADVRLAGQESGPSDERACGLREGFLHVPPILLVAG